MKKIEKMSKWLSRFSLIAAIVCSLCTAYFFHEPIGVPIAYLAAGLLPLLDSKSD